MFPCKRQRRAVPGCPLDKSISMTLGPKKEMRGSVRSRATDTKARCTKGWRVGNECPTFPLPHRTPTLWAPSRSKPLPSSTSEKPKRSLDPYHAITKPIPETSPTHPQKNAPEYIPAHVTVSQGVADASVQICCGVSSVGMENWRPSRRRAAAE